MMTELDIFKNFALKVAEYCIDIGKDKIIEADKNRKVNGQSIETRIYQVVIDALNEFPYNEYKKKEQVYDAAESILKQFRSSRGDYKENVRAGLEMIVPQVTIETCEDFLGTLHNDICINKNDILYKEIILLQGKQTFEAVSEGFDVSNKNDEETHEKLDYVIEGLNNIDKKINGVGNYAKRYYEIPIKNRVDEYAKRWNENVFLNNFNEEDENIGTEIKLSELYIEKCLPHYIWKTNTNLSDKLNNLLAKYVIDKNGKKMLLILGQPGMGKSTLITWMMANLVEKKEDIYVYQFAFDLKNVNWESDNILHEIFEVLNLRYDELENKTLILDGFDEIYVNGNRERILNKMNQELKRINFLQNFFLFMTCRENYVDRTKLEENDYITLQAWDKEQIKCFCEIYEEIIKKNTGIENNRISRIKINRILEKKEIFGIPLILYMILALDVDVEKGSSLMDIYDQIFSFKRGGIYDRCYDSEHRINAPEIKKHIHCIFQKIAFYIFENNADEAAIAKEKFEEICENEMSVSEGKSEKIQSDTLIGNFFCEGKRKDELKFVHRSIYEYFVVIYFFESICKLQSKEEVARKLGDLLKNGCLSEQILEYTKCKFGGIEKYNLSDVAKDIFNIMLHDGMLCQSKEAGVKAMDLEMNIFSNMLKVVHLWNDELRELDNKLICYLKYNHLTKLDLRGIDLKEANLKEANLKEANLRGADLRGANLFGVNLREADLEEANLMGVNLMGANLRRANLRGADLRGANLIETNLFEADLFGTNLEATIYDRE